MSTQDSNPRALAVVALGAMFPGSRTVAEYWRDIVQGTDRIKEVPTTHWLASDYVSTDPKAIDTIATGRGAFIDTVDFPPVDFGIVPNAVEATDSSQLLGLLVAKQVLDDMEGPFQAVDKARTGVVVGVASTTELVAHMAARLQIPVWKRALEREGLDGEVVERVISAMHGVYAPWQESTFPGLLGNVVSGRIASRFDLGGPNAVVDAACASSLAAVEIAANQLDRGQIDLAITGGVDALNDIVMFMCFGQTGALSPTGDARPFSADADGTVLGEGLGLIALKRLEDAERHGDRIYAVLRGIGSSSDGRAKSIYAPRPEGQALAISRAYEEAGYSPASVELVEAHGTGTVAGDLAELTSTGRVFSEGGAARNGVAIGSVKAQIGHTKAAAGAAGLIKVILSVQQRVLPPTTKISEPNEALADSPFYLNTTPRPWIRADDQPRRASVSAFGFGGTNFHVAVEEYRGATRRPRLKTARAHLLVLSGETREAVASELASVSASIRDGGDLRTMSRQTQARFDPRAGVRLSIPVEEGQVGQQIDAALSILGSARDRAVGVSDAADRLEAPTGMTLDAGPVMQGKLAALFPGQGSQYVGMGGALALAFDDVIDAWEAAAAEASIDGRRLSDVVFPPAPLTKEGAELQQAELTRTEWAQPAIATHSLAAFRLLERAGVAVDALAGHSLGELSALAAAGAMTDRSAIRLAQRRGQLMRQASERPGRMLAVVADKAAFEDWWRAQPAELTRLLTVANENSRRQRVLAGPSEAIAEIESALVAADIQVRPLRVSTAFHSPIVAGAVEPFHRALEASSLDEPTRPVYSNVSARPYAGGASALRAQLAQAIAQPVRFLEQIEAMYDDGVRVFIEVGPSAVLTRLVGDILEGRPHLVVPLDNPSKGLETWWGGLGRLATAGVAIDFSRLWDDADPLVEPAPKPRFVVPVGGANPTPEGRRQLDDAATSESPQVKATKPRSLSELGPTPAMPTAERSPSPTLATKKSPTPTLATKKSPTPSLPTKKSPTPSLPSQRTSSSPEARVSQPLGSRETATNGSGAPPSFRSLPVEHNPPDSFVSSSGQALVPPGAVTPLPEGLRATMPSSAPALDLDRIEDLQAAAIEAQREYQRLMAESHQAFLRLLAESASSSATVSRADVNGLPTSPALVERRYVSAEPSASIESTPPAVVPSSAVVSGAPAAPPSEPTEASVPSPSEMQEAQDIIGTMLEVVADKTGYPADMLHADMNLEADLGIDSIKRVEILSAVRTALPSLPEVDAGELGALQTLGEIAGAFQAKGGAADALPPPPVAQLSTSDASPLPPEGGVDVIGTMLEVVADKTGYPADMLHADMNLEADLGIDSIKRVEILSAVRTALPSLPEVDAGELGALQTLGEIAGAFQAKGGAADALPPPPDAQLSTSDASPLPPEGGVDVIGTMLEVVADKTGYPADMLHADMNLEADLGIDSIKRVEILSAVRTALPSLPEVDAGELGALQTLGEIAAAFGSAPDTDTAHADAHPEPIAEGTSVGAASDIVHRHVVAVDAPAAGLAVFRPGATVSIVPDRRGVAALLQDMLRTAGYDPSIQQPGRSLAPSLVDLRALNEVSSVEEALEVQRSMFVTAREFVSNEPKAYVTVQDTGGDFGLSGAGDRAWLAGIAALTKTVGLEHPECSVRAIDVAWAGSAQATSQRLFDELVSGGPEVEVGLTTDGARCTLGVEAHRRPPGTPILPGAVFVVSGGARGVTAAAVIALARQTPVRLALLGRTPLVEEPAELSSATTDAELKRAVIERMRRSGVAPDPKTVGAEVAQVSAVREIRATITAIRAAGAEAEYWAVDVNDRTALAATLDVVRARWGGVSGVVHAAGVLADAKLADKTDAQYARVVSTKLVGLQGLLEATREDPLTHLCLFSSVAARQGNVGQVDYAMANETLHKVAISVASNRPRIKVTSLGWGPWDGGMVNPALKSFFESRGVGLIPVERGAEAFVEAMTDGDPSVERVIGCGDLVDGRTIRGYLTIDPVQVPPLEDHRINGTIVVPVALMIEWMGRWAGALGHGEDWTLSGVQVLRGITLAGRDVTVEFTAEPRGEGTDIDIYDLDGRKRYAASMRSSHPSPEKLTSRPVSGEKMSAEAAADALFHGPKFLAIQSVDGLDDLGAEARLAVTADRDWPQQRWVTDPVLIDGALQLAVVWGRKRLNKMTLPMRVETFVQRSGPSGAATHGTVTHDQSVHCALSVTARSEHHFVCDVVLSKEGHVVAELIGVQMYAITRSGNEL